MKTTSVICENIVSASPEVVKWNSWDSEHLRTVHKAYNSPISLMSRPNDGLFIDKFSIPILKIKFKSMVFTTQWDENNQISFTLTPFFLAKNKITVIPLSEYETLVRVCYEFSGNWFQSLLFPIFVYLIKKWNKVVWEEDLPLKLRRQKALSYGFVDYRGIPDNLSKRIDRSKTYKTPIPAPITRGIMETAHPFFEQK